jgi:hypothetical protein
LTVQCKLFQILPWVFVTVTSACVGTLQLNLGLQSSAGRCCVHAGAALASIDSGITVTLEHVDWRVVAVQGANRPSARAITLALLHKPYFKAVSGTNGSILAAAVGQLICKSPRLHATSGVPSIHQCARGAGTCIFAAKLHYDMPCWQPMLLHSMASRWHLQALQHDAPQTFFHIWIKMFLLGKYHTC